MIHITGTNLVFIETCEFSSYLIYIVMVLWTQTLSSIDSAISFDER